MAPAVLVRQQLRPVVPRSVGLDLDVDRDHFVVGAAPCCFFFFFFPPPLVLGGGSSRARAAAAAAGGQDQDQDMNMNSPPVESIPEPVQTQDILISKPISIDSTEPATKHVPTNPIPANTVNAMSQRLGLTSEDKTNMQSIITKVFANAGTFASEKLGHMMEGFESKSSIASTSYM